MKFKHDQKYFNIAVYSFLVIALSIIFYLVVSEVEGVFIHLKSFTGIFKPIIIGFIMAYLFNFILRLIEEKLLNRFDISQKTIRFIGVILTYLVVFTFVVLFLEFILPQLVSSLIGLVNDIPIYAREITKVVNDLGAKLDFNSEFNSIIIDQIDNFVNNLITITSDLVPKIGGFIKLIFSSISNIILGLIISTYVLVDKERFGAMYRKIIVALLPSKGADKTQELVVRADRIFGNFISGKILDSMIVAVLTFVLLMIFKIPYTLLVSFIIGLTNIIPFFGPFIGAIPSFFIILFISPQKAFFFLILIVIIQQIDGNIIGPKILGDSLGISPFWILFSLLVSGKIFGVIGLIIGVPLFVFIYSIIKDLIEYQLKRKKLPINTQHYEK